MYSVFADMLLRVKNILITMCGAVSAFVYLGVDNSVSIFWSGNTGQIDANHIL